MIRVFVEFRANPVLNKTKSGHNNILESLPPSLTPRLFLWIGHSLTDSFSPSSGVIVEVHFFLSNVPLSPNTLRGKKYGEIDIDKKEGERNTTAAGARAHRAFEYEILIICTDFSVARPEKLGKRRVEAGGGKTQKWPSPKGHRETMKERMRRDQPPLTTLHCRRFWSSHPFNLGSIFSSPFHSKRRLLVWLFPQLLHRKTTKLVNSLDRSYLVTSR